MTQVPQIPSQGGSADCLTTSTKAGAPGAASPQQIASTLFRSADGKTRVDSGNMSIITDPVGQKTIMLNHLTKEAQILPFTKVPSQPQIPGLPGGMPGGLPLNPSAPPMNVQDLGKSMIDGHEVMGKRYTFPPPPALQPPGMPQVPGVAGGALGGGLAGAVPGALAAAGVKAPGVPGAPGMPGAPKIPQPMTTEVWTSTKLHLPVLTKTTGSFGEQTCKCKPTAGEPAASLFQIPQGYTTVPTPAPPSLTPKLKLPGFPR